MLRLVFWAIVFSALANFSVAQEASDTLDALCEQRDSSEFIRIAVCNTNGSDADFADEGQRLCGEQLPCGVWFWLDGEAAPAEAPFNHDGLDQAEITSAVGVWVAEKATFIRIEALQN